MASGFPISAVLTACSLEVLARWRTWKEGEGALNPLNQQNNPATLTCSKVIAFMLNMLTRVTASTHFVMVSTLTRIGPILMHKGQKIQTHLPSKSYSSGPAETGLILIPYSRSGVMLGVHVS